MQVKLTIQERLKDLRVERGLTLEQLAEQTGLSKSALGKYEADDFKDISPSNNLNQYSPGSTPENAFSSRMHRNTTMLASVQGRDTERNTCFWSI